MGAGKFQFPKSYNGFIIGFTEERLNNIYGSKYALE